MNKMRYRTVAFLASTAMVVATVPVVATTTLAEPLDGGSQPAPAVTPPGTPPVRPTPEQLRARREKRAKELRWRLVKVARVKARSARYSYGATGPQAFDCSGFTMWLYRTVARRRLSHWSVAQMRETKRVTRRHLLPGDLLFWGPGGSQHVSMYIGNGKMIGANNPRSGIRVDSINAPWWRNKFAGAGRVIVV